MNSSSDIALGLSQTTKHEVLENVLKALQSKFYKPELLGADWLKSVQKQRTEIETAPT